MDNKEKGYVKIHLSKMLGEKRISRKQLGEMTNIRPSTISDIYNEKSKMLSLDNIASICYVLKCSISDLLEYVPYKKN